MKIILIGERYSSNLGDGVIYDTVEIICKDIYGEVEFISLDISGGSSYNQNRNLRVDKIKLLFPKVRRILSRLKRKTLLKKKLQSIDIKSVDGAIFVGGQLFMEYFSEQILTIAKFLNKNNIPTIYNSCGFGKKYTKKTVSQLREALLLPNVKAISLRDNIEPFKEVYGKDINVIKALDPVVELNKFYDRKDSGERVGIGLIEPKLFLHNNIDFTYSDYGKLVKIIIEELDNRKIEWEFFCNGSESDYNFIEEICEKNGIKKNISNRPTTPLELIETIDQYSSIISFRLHSHIIATSLGKNVIGFNWDNKVLEFSKTIDLEDNFLDLNEDVFDKMRQFVKSSDFSFQNKNYQYDNSIIKSSQFLSDNRFEVK